MIDVTSPAFRIKIGVIIIAWGLIVSTISFYNTDFNVENGIINTSFMMGSTLLGIGVFKPKN